MNVLYHSSVFPHPARPTRGVYNLSLCRALAARPGVSVRVVAPRPWPEALRHRRGPALDAGAIGPVAYPTFWYPPKVARRRLADWLDRSSAAAVRAATRRWRPDVVLSYWADPDGTAAQRAARRLGAKSALIVGGSDVLLLPTRGDLDGVVEQTLAGSDLIATVSESLADSCRTLPVGGTPVRCLRQGVDARLFRHGPKDAARRSLGLTEGPTFVWVGRLDPVKNLPLLLRALAELRRDVPARLVVVGGGPERAAVEADVAALGLGEAVTLAGAVPPDRLGEYYRAADAAVLSSHSEGLPNVLREALACGRPFASVDVGSVREIGDDRCRALCPPGDATALADAMKRALDPAMADALASYRPRTWADAAADFESAFHDLVGRPAAAPREAVPA